MVVSSSDQLLLASTITTTDVAATTNHATIIGTYGSISRHNSRPKLIDVEDMRTMMIKSNTRTTSSSSSNAAVIAAVGAIGSHKIISATPLTITTSLGSRECEREQRDDLDDIRSAGRRQPRPTAAPLTKHNNKMAAAAIAVATAPITTRPTDAAMRLRFGLPPKKEMMKDTKTTTSSSSKSVTASATVATATAHKATTAAVAAVAHKTIPATPILSLGLHEQRDDLEDIRSTDRRQPRPPVSPRTKPNKIMVVSTHRPTDAAMRLRFGLPPKKEMKRKDSSSIIVAKNNSSDDNGSLSTSTIFASLKKKDIVVKTTASASCTVGVDATSSFRATTTRLPFTTTTCSTSKSEITNTTSATSTAATNKSSIIDNTIKSLNRFLSIPLSIPKMPELFSCTGGSSAYHNVDSGSVGKKLNHNENYDDYTKKFTARHHQIDKQLSLKLTSSHTEEERGDWQSGETTPTTISTTSFSTTYEYEEDENTIFNDDNDDNESTTTTTTTTELSPRIMMFYQDEEEEEDVKMMMMAPPPAVVILPYSLSPPPSKLSSFADNALILTLDDDEEEEDDDDDDDNDNDDDCNNNDYDDNEWGIFLSFSEDEQHDHKYDYSSSPSMKFNVFHTPSPFINHAATITSTGGGAVAKTTGFAVTSATTRTIAC